MNLAIGPSNVKKDDTRTAPIAGRNQCPTYGLEYDRRAPRAKSTARLGYFDLLPRDRRQSQGIATLGSNPSTRD